MNVMKKAIRSLGILLLALIIFLPLNSNKAYAYTLKDLGSYIENPEFHNNQSGRADGNVGLYKAVGETEVATNVKELYFDSTHKTFQILARRYNPTKEIDKTSKDMKWSVVDKRICTVDSKGFVTAGNMTGATIVILEDETYCLSIPVVNRTGKYDSWYEDMFKDIDTPGNIYRKEGFKYASSAKIACEYLGKGYKIIVDAYLTHGSKLRTDPDVRFNTIQDAVCTITDLARLENTNGGIWGDCVVIASLISIICDPFTINSKTQKFGCDMVDLPGHVTNVILLDGIVYSVDNEQFQEVAKESDWTWKNGVLYGSYIFGNNKAEAEISCKKGTSYSFTQDRDKIEKYLKNGINNN
jgi:hypothetical protein